MGYRSEVRLVIAKEGFEVFSKHFETVEGNARYYFDNMDIKQEREDDFLLGWHDTKWYDEHIDVKEIEAALEELNELTEYGDNEEALEKYYFLLIRLGEDGEEEEFTNDHCDTYTYDAYVTSDFSGGLYEQNDKVIYNVFLEDGDRWYMLSEDELKDFKEPSHAAYKIVVNPAGIIVEDEYSITRVGKTFKEEYGISLNDYNKKNPPLPKVSRQAVAEALEAVEMLLEKHNMTIPDSERTGDVSEARIYGQAYYDLEDEIYKILNK